MTPDWIGFTPFLVPPEWNESPEEYKKRLQAKADAIREESRRSNLAPATYKGGTEIIAWE